jgi:L-2,4-diaminobutyrate decarboxylase
MGALLLTDPRALSALEFRADYALNGEEHAHDAGAFHLEGSRRLEALKAWMTIKYFGKKGFSTLIDYTFTLAHMFAEFIAATDDFELVTRPDTNIICFRYADRHFDDMQLDALNLTVQKRLFQNGGPLLSTTKIDGRTVLRMVLLNPRTTLADLLHGLDRVRCVAREEALSIRFSIGMGRENESLTCN